MNKVPCPGCGALLELEQEVCSSCRRPRDEREIGEGRNRLSELALKQRRLPRIIAAWILVAISAAGLYGQREVVLGTFAGLRADFTREMEAVARPAPGPLSPAAQAMLSALSVPREGPIVAVVAHSPRPPKPSELPEHATRPPEPHDPVGGQQRIYGVVYDMLTANVVAGARLYITGDGNSSWQAVTNIRGHYMIDVPTDYIDRPEGVIVRVEAAGYKTGQLEDSDPPYRERTEEQRRSAFAEIAPSDLEPPSIRSRRSASLVPFDIVLIRDEPAKTDPAP